MECEYFSPFYANIKSLQCFTRQPQQFGGFFRRVLQLALDEEGALTLMEQSCVLTFLVHCFNSLEVDLIRQHTAPLYSFHIWDNLLPVDFIVFLQYQRSFFAVTTRATAHLGAEVAAEVVAQVEGARCENGREGASA